jgi:hypothetical protein
MQEGTLKAIKIGVDRAVIVPFRLVPQPFVASEQNQGKSHIA